MRMFLYFGDIFCFDSSIKRTSFVELMAKGGKISTAITAKMEAFMRTIIEVGCGKDWPEYLKSPELKAWKEKEATKRPSEPNKKPVSYADCCCC